MFRERRDPIGFRDRKRGQEMRVYIPKGIMFGSGYDWCKKYLPCIAIIDEHSGDLFYNFTMLTEDGPVKSCGYGAWFIPLDELETYIDKICYTI